MSKQPFFVEVTDTFGGEANYSWVTRHVILAKSERGVINALARRTGLNWRAQYQGCYHSTSGATCAFIDAYDPMCHQHYHLDTGAHPQESQA